MKKHSTNLPKTYAFSFSHVNKIYNYVIIFKCFFLLINIYLLLINTNYLLRNTWNSVALYIIIITTTIFIKTFSPFCPQEVV